MAYYADYSEKNRLIEESYKRMPNQTGTIETMRREKRLLLGEILEMLSLTQTIGDENGKLKDAFGMEQKGSESGTADFQSGSMDIAERVACAKLGITLAAQIAETRVSDTKKDGCEIVRPEVTPQELRAYCVAAYDALLPVVKAQSSMYIPDLIERTEPDASRCTMLLRRYDMQTKQTLARTQAGNKALNRLFGSRG